MFEELQNFLDALRTELDTDAVQVLGFVPPELDFGGGERVSTALERVLGVLLEDVLDLLLPVNNGGFKSVSLIFGRAAVRLSHIGGRERQESLTLNLTHSDVGVGEEAVELLHEVLGDKFAQVNLVEWVVEDGKEHFLACCVEVFKNWFVQLHENDLVGNIFRKWTGLGASLHNDERLLRDGLLLWRINGECQEFSFGDAEQPCTTSTDVVERRSVVIVVKDLRDGLILDLTEAKVDETVLDYVLLGV